MVKLSHTPPFRCFFFLRFYSPFTFLTGCDAFGFAELQGNNLAEKDGPPNVSLHTSYLLDNAKKAVEALRPSIVSCTYTSAFVAIDALVIINFPSGGSKIHQQNLIFGTIKLEFSYISSFSSPLAVSKTISAN